MIQARVNHDTSRHHVSAQHLPDAKQQLIPFGVFNNVRRDFAIFLSFSTVDTTVSFYLAKHP